MVSAATYSVGMVGLEGAVVEVEAFLASGLARTVIVGLPDASLNEARDRVRAAIAGIGLYWPEGRVTINLSPASVPKMGTHYDLAIATALLAAMREIPRDGAREYVILGELGLAGQVRRVRGILPALLAAQNAGITKAIVPVGQAREAALVPGITAWPVSCLADVREILRGNPYIPPEETDDAEAEEPSAPTDLSDVQGHRDGKWALEVAAAGRHHIFLHGAPGVGKTMLASRLPGILPDLSPVEALEVSALHSLAGVELHSGLVTRPPYADPHHNSTMASLVGGGSREIRPGAVSMAHRGVLFMDEAPEFGSRLMDSLRTPLENGWITIARAHQTVRYPARFQLVLAANPCPCGNAGVAGQQCLCPPLKIRAYQERISGPIMDRIDIRHHMLPLRRAFLNTDQAPESSAAVLQRVMAARDRQARRLKDSPWSTNGEVAGSYMRRHLPLPSDVSPLERALRNGTMTARGVDKCLKVAWTLADLEGTDTISANQLRMAMAMRQGDTSEV